MATAVCRTLPRGLILAALAALCACGLPQRYRAAEDVRAFFEAVRNDDRAAFEAHIDRPALRRGLRQQLDQAAAGAGLGLGALESFLGGRRGDELADQMISPRSFRLVWRRSGISTDRVPSAPEIAALLRMNGADEACLHDFKSGRCVLTFHNEGGTFKLADVAASAVKIGRGGTAS